MAKKAVSTKKRAVAPKEEATVAIEKHLTPLKRYAMAARQLVLF